MAIQKTASLRAEAALLRATIVVQRTWRRSALRAASKRNHAARVIQRSWRRARFLFNRQQGAMKIQTHFRMWTLLQKYSVKRFSAIKFQTHWRRTTKRKAYLDVIQKVILLQSSIRRLLQGVVEVQRRKMAVQVAQKYARRWLAIRLLRAMKKQRLAMIRCSIRCQVSLLLMCRVCAAGKEVRSNLI